MAKLIALDGDDLAVLSAFCQDALVQASDMQFSAKTSQFILPMRRFAWEALPKRKWWQLKRPSGERRNAILHFGQVTNIQSQNLHHDRDAAMVLLNMDFEADKEDASGKIELKFAGNATIKLAVGAIEAKLNDLGGAWQAVATPDHKL